MHHVSIRTANIHRAIAFYELLGFQVCERFTTGYTLACWLEGWGGRLELIEIPEPHPPADAFGDEHYTGYYHLSLDLSARTASLPEWLAGFAAEIEDAIATARTEQGQAPNLTHLTPLRILLPPQQQQIGTRVYEVAFVADADGLPIELLRILGE